MSAPTTATASTRNSTTTCWTAISTFLKNLASGCFITHAINKVKGIEFAYYYPEGDGYLLVGKLGAGIEGTVVLVRLVSDQQLYARKRKDFAGALDPSRDPSNDADFAILHENIPRILEQTTLSGLNNYTRRPATTTAGIIQYCNSGDVSNVMDKAKDLDLYRIPSVLAWRLVCQLLSVTIVLHHEGIIHYDIKANNVFIHWTDGKLVPDFFLGDFGCAKRMVASEQGRILRGFDFRSVLNLCKCVANVKTVAGGVPIPNGSEGESWEALDRSLRDLGELLKDYEGIEDKPGFEKALRELEEEVKKCEQEWREKLDGDLSKYRKVNDEKLRVFQSKKALLEDPERKPPDPWQIAKVQQKGGAWRVLKTYGEVYCKDEHDFSR